MKKILQNMCVIALFALLFLLIGTYNKQDKEYVTSNLKEESYAVYSGKNVYEYYRTTLDEEEQSAYDDIKEAYLQFKPEFSTLAQNISKQDLKDAFVAVILDHSEIFWIDSYKATVNVFGNINTNKAIKLRYAYTEEESIHIKQKIQVNYNEIIEEAKNLKTDYEKVKFVHDKLIQIADYTDYKKNEKADFQSIVSIFDTGESVCSGYAYAFKFIMDNLGIKAISVESIDDNSPSNSHIWNMVYINEQWYNLDVTWDDQLTKGNNISYKYFLLDNDEFYKDHTIQDNLPNI